MRVLQEKEVERLGSRKVISLDVRVIATSNRDLKQAVAEHKFREDLYYRLNVFPLKWKPLYQRPLDIIPLAEYLLQKHALENQMSIPVINDKAKAMLQAYSFPGNVRELDNIMQRALILSAGNVVDDTCIILDESYFEKVIENETSDKEISLRLEQNEHIENEEVSLGSIAEAISKQKVPNTLGSGLKQQEFQTILDALIELKGNRQAVSEKLSISPRTLRYKIAKMRDMGIIIPG